MNVVGKVGSLISQGVHSVTAPFLPFGGAVDIIVVQQLDGTFRSTPWHVRFGKSQGALKEEDKIVRVTVNGVEAEFFMYLDNSGAAYFVREVGSGEGSDGDMVLKHPDNVVGTQEQSSINDTNNVIMEQYGGNGNDVYNVMIQLQDEGSELAVDQIERMESDSEMKFYEFQDVQSSFESSAELSEYGSNWYYSDIDRVKHQKKSWDLNPEVVLMSVGGCILTAPISSSKEKITDVQSCTPQSHFELDLGTKYFEANADFRTGEEAALTDYSRDLPTSSPKFRSENSCSISNIDSAFRQQLKVFEAEGDHLYQVEENENVANQGGDHCADRNLEATWTDIREEDVFKSCLDLAALVTLNEDSSREVLDSPLEPHKVIGDSREKSPSNLQSANETGVRDFGESKKITSSNPSPHGDVMCPSRGVKPIECTNNSPGKVVFLDSESCLQNQSIEPTSTSSSVSGSPHKQLIRTNVPTTEQVVSLGLKEGQNMLTFSFSTGGLGLQQLDACIYLWKWNARIVISDVDGTITKSDVLGQFMPLVGREWTQSGVARLYSAIKENGYELLFLSARAIVQAYLTRSFLLNLKQDGKALPNGPVVISPDGLFPALYREVIRRTPHEFKIACLKDIKALFPSDYNPFYAGFGNRDSDELSYRKIGIPEGKIFIINPKGEVAINHRLDVKSYASIHKLVDDMFPPTSMFEQEDFNSWNYWKMPLPDVDC